MLIIDANHCFFRILTTTSNIHRYFCFNYKGAFNIAHSIRNISGCTLLYDVKLTCINTSECCTLIFCRFYIDFYYSLFISCLLNTLMTFLWFWLHVQVFVRDDTHSRRGLMPSLKWGKDRMNKPRRQGQRTL